MTSPILQINELSSRADEHRWSVAERRRCNHLFDVDIRNVDAHPTVARQIVPPNHQLIVFQFAVFGLLPLQTVQLLGHQLTRLYLVDAVRRLRPAPQPVADAQRD